MMESARSSILPFENIDKIQTIAFQPVSFTGRDEEIEDELRQAQRYTLAQNGRGSEGSTQGRLGADARLVSAVVVQRFHERDGYAPGSGCAVGLERL